MYSSGTGYSIYGLTLAASTMVPLQGFWNFWVYARPRYLKNGIGFSVFRSAATIRYKRTTGNKSNNASNGSSENPQNNTQTNPAGETSFVKSTIVNTSITTNTKSSVPVNSDIAMESEVVPFGASDEPEVVSFEVADAKDDEPEVIPFGAPDPAVDERFEFLLAG
jgi:hypothetical protein